MANRSRPKHSLSNINLQESSGVKSRVFVGTCTALFLVVALGGWAATSELSGAVIAPGVVKVDKDLRSVQHLDGGIIRAISVQNGDIVKEGQVLFTLDHTQMKAELQIVRGQLVELLSKRQRLLAERDQLDAILPIDGYEDLGIENSSVLKGEVRLFIGNKETRASQIEQLKLGIAQLEEEINGLVAQENANKSELKLVQAEADKVQKLQAKGLVAGTRTYASNRDLTNLKGERGQIEASGPAD